MFRYSILILTMTLSATTAGAQQPAAAGTPQPPRVVPGQDGFAIESGNGDFRLQVGLIGQLDGRFALDDSGERFVDTFAIRRLRPYLRGRISRRFEFFLNPDFAGGTFVVQDAYVDTLFAPALRLRAGKGKTPFGFERLHSASNLLFIDRALPTQVAPNRDLGIQVLGDVAGGVVSYLAGVMNGVPDGGSADSDVNDGKDASGRLIVRPFNRTPAGSPARGLALAISGSTGSATATPLPSFRTPNIQNPFFSYAAGAAADGARRRYSPQVWYFYKSFGAWSEYVHSATTIRRNGTAAEIGHDAWQVAASWVLSGETATDAGPGIRPAESFGSGDGAWGALQIAARYHTLEVDEEAVTRGFAAPGASRSAEAWTLGLNWYLTGNFRYTLNFERTVFDDGAAGARPAENALAFRTQINF